MSQDRDKTPLPADPDAAASDEELGQAQALAAALEAGGDAAGAVGDSELADLLAASELVRAGVVPRPLTAARREALLDEVFDAGVAAAVVPPADAARSRRRRVAPLVALAATVLLAIGAVIAGMPLFTRDAEPGRRAVSAASAGVPVWTLSRPSNDLLGRPIEDRAGASRRLDRVFADRMAGYRRLTLARVSPADLDRARFHPGGAR